MDPFKTKARFGQRKDTLALIATRAWGVVGALVTGKPVLDVNPARETLPITFAECVNRVIAIPQNEGYKLYAATRDFFSEETMSENHDLIRLRPLGVCSDDQARHIVNDFKTACIPGIPHVQRPVIFKELKQKVAAYVGVPAV